jgi:glycosyltransferase involved in cell wall biosynthesis
MVRIAIASPFRPAEHSGNDVTAKRWALRCRNLGHDVDVVGYIEDTDVDEAQEQVLRGVDMLIVLHARRGVTVGRWWRTHRPDDPLVVGLAGTDLYMDMPDHAGAMDLVAAADHVIVLQEAAVDRVIDLVPSVSDRVTVVHQSVDIELPERQPPHDEFVVVVLAHLREVKDPLMAARAVRELPDESRIVVRHGGAAHDSTWSARASEEHTTNHRYQWLGGLERPEALSLLASASVLACTSLFEGGANVVTEALAMGIPVVGTRIDGNTGLLGADYPGLVEVADDLGLRDLLLRLEASDSALELLTRLVAGRKHVTEAAGESRALRFVIDAVT